MDELHHLLHSLSSKEKQLLRITLTSYGDRKPTTSVRLLDFLLRSRKPPLPEECECYLYGKKSPRNRLTNLKAHLTGKTYEALIHPSNLNSNPHLSAKDRAVIRINRQMAVLYFLYCVKRERSAWKKILDEIIRQSVEAEYYPAAVEALRMKKYTEGYRMKTKNYSDAEKLIRRYEEYNRMLYKSADYYSNIAYYFQRTETHFSQKADAALRRAIEKVSDYHSLTKSGLILYFLKQLEFAFYTNRQQFKQSKKCCLEIIELLNSNKMVFRNEWMGMAYADLARSEIFLHEYEPALRDLELAKEYIAAEAMNYGGLLENTYYANMHSGLSGRAQFIAGRLIKTAPDSQGDFRYAKYQYYYACALFTQKKFKQAIKILAQHLEISKDKPGWETGIRILKIMTWFEMDDDVSASKEVFTLKKFLYRVSKHAKTGKREKLILSALNYLDSNGYEIKRSDSRLKEYVAKLSSSEKEYSWNPLSHEIIPFHHWLAEKMKHATPHARSRVPAT